MSLIYISFFRDKKKAGLVALVPLLIGTCILLSAVVIGFGNLHKQNTYIETSAVITNVDFSDRQHPYTELTYQGENQRHVVNTEGYLGQASREVEILYKPSNPKQFVIVRSMKAKFESQLVSAGIMLIISSPFVINYLIIWRRDKLRASACESSNNEGLNQ